MSNSSSTFNGGFSPGDIVERRYRIVRELGRGGMGAVYEAEQIKLQKQVALKVLQSERAKREDGNSSLKRFLREARAASSIQHRNVVTILDFGDLEDGSTYYVMELLKGRDLSSLLKTDGAIEWPRARRLLRQVLSALGAAHDKGIIHRDIKPANIMLLEDTDEWGNEWVKVLDFGIAKLQEVDEESQSLTGTSELLGTAAYMAPELVRGDPTDARADLYAVGIVAYQLLTGAVPFQAVNTFQVLLRHINDAPPPLREIVPHLSPAVDAFILRALNKNPDQRHQSAAAMIEELDELGDSPLGVFPSGVAPLDASPVQANTEVATRPPSTAVVAPAVGGRGGTKGTERYQPFPSSSPVDAPRPAIGSPTNGSLLAQSGASSPSATEAIEAMIDRPLVALAPRRTPWLAMVGVGGAAVLATWLVIGGSESKPSPGAASVVEAADPKPSSEATSPEPETVEPETVEPETVGPEIVEPETVGMTSDADEPPVADASTGEPPKSDGPEEEEEDAVVKKGTPRGSKCQTYECRQQRAESLIQKAVKRRCRSLATGDVVKVKLTIATDGRALMPRALPPHEQTALGECVVEAVAKGRFPPPEKLSPKELRLKP